MADKTVTMDQVILSGLTVLAHWAALMPAYRISGGHSIKIQDPSYSQINALVSEHSSRPIQHTAGHFRVTLVTLMPAYRISHLPATTHTDHSYCSSEVLWPHCSR